MKDRKQIQAEVKSENRHHKKVARKNYKHEALEKVKKEYKAWPEIVAERRGTKWIRGQSIGTEDQSQKKYK